MEKIKLITDSASDISIEDEKKYGIRVLPFKVAMGTKSYISRVDFDNEQFYKLMDEYPGIPVTSQLTPIDFENIYEEEYNNGNKKIILILINSEGSQTYNNAIIAKNEFFEQYPERVSEMDINLFDGANYCAGYGAVVLEAAIKLNNNCSYHEVLNFIDNRLRQSMIYFGMYSLKYAAKSGRIPSAAAFVGEALNLKPIMKIYDHKIITAAKAHGERKLITGIVEKTKKDMIENTPYYLIYGSDSSVLEILKDKVEAEFGYPCSGAFQIGAAIAINAGPKVVGIAFQSKEKF